MFIFNPTLYSMVLLRYAEYNQQMNKGYAPLSKEKANVVRQVLAALSGWRQGRKQAAQAAQAA
jgi:hypothetical protein